MIQIGDTIISRDLIERYFCCNLMKCKGACCIEGDAGAPLEKDEFKKLQEILPFIWDDLSVDAQAVISRQGVGYIDRENDIVTSIVNGKNCVFTYYDVMGICKCAIEKAYRENRIDFMKPVSCRLYPIRLKQYKDFLAVNYHRYSVCRNAEKHGEQKCLRLYQFLSDQLIYRFGIEWYQALNSCAKHFFLK
ncbi:MAG: DUF3109 family protein [Oscillospiraceae bacterium]|nr:DUF3109 family protein [Oscillospiraceae bacterium]